ncbi:putative membrane protein (Partial match) [Frankia canadensis]|uniref:Putative membrane protein (Partial match) n=1 Tax=Frankia canadensis TaxID=1836972 RepID=A0A2I2KQY8_9ACTN|nr:MMPL family transporter [Frankia canadensis]SNQ48069.1 putative membrane protein (Partial match) [Frankia canadensis]SOU55359.1 putative membrane protein (Partial match) [Frankia canadensis]
MPLFADSAPQRHSRTDSATSAALTHGAGGEEDGDGVEDDRWTQRLPARPGSDESGPPVAPPRVMASMASMAGVPAPRRSLFTVAADVAVLHRGRLLAAACLLVVVLLPWNAGIYHQLATGGFYAPSDGSTRAEQLLDAEFPDAPPNVAVMLTAAEGIDGPTPAHLGRELTRQLSAEPGVTSVLSYWPNGSAAGNALLRSKDGRSALIVFRLTGSEDHIQTQVERLHARYSHLGPGVMVRFGGAPAVMRDVTERSRTDLERGELTAAPLVFLLLLYAFGTVAAAMLPVLVGVVSVVSSLALLRLAATVTDISVFSVNLTTALGFGLAVDYSLFILRRFREEQERGLFPGAALRRTLETAGRTVFFSGVTVALSLTAALVFPLYYLRSFAFAGVIVVVASEVAALLVLPAALMLLGDRLDRGDIRAALRRARAGRRGAAGPRHAVDPRANLSGAGRGWTALARRVMRWPLLYGAVAVGVLLLCAAPLRGLNLALADDTVLPSTAESHVVNDAMRSDFVVCLPCQIPIVVPGVDARDPANAARLTDYASRLSALPGVARVDTVSGGFMQGRQVSEASAATTGYVGTHGGAWLAVWQSDTSPVSAAAKDLVGRLRATPAPFGVLMGGLAPHFLDTADTIERSLPLAFAIVMCATFLLLFLFTGSVLLPLKAMLLNSLNLAATIGLLTFIFQEGHLRGLVGDFQVSGTLEMTSPVLMFFIAFGLSMDYEIFLLARIREEYQRTGDNTESVAVGLGATGPLITSVALALVVVMVALSTSHISMIKLVGVGLTIAITLDVTVVRAILVPAFMALAGRYNWWAPPALRRLHDRFGLREDGEEATPGPAHRVRSPESRRFSGPTGITPGRRHGSTGVPGGARYALPPGPSAMRSPDGDPVLSRDEEVSLAPVGAGAASSLLASDLAEPWHGTYVTIEDPTAGGYRDPGTRRTTRIRYRRPGDEDPWDAVSQAPTPTWQYYHRRRWTADSPPPPVVTGARGFVLGGLGVTDATVLDADLYQ